MQAQTKGYTLLELLLTISLIAILTLFAIPQYQEIQYQSRVKLARLELIRAIHLARAYAIQETQSTFLCGSDDQQHCSNQWQVGHIIVGHDKVKFSVHHRDYGDVIYLRLFPRQLTQLQFLSSGQTNFQNGTFWFCGNNRENPEWAVVMNQSGRARLVYPDEYGRIQDLNCHPYLVSRN